MRRTMLAALVVLASNAGDQSCEAAGGYDCHVETRGLEVEAGRVTDVVTNSCAAGREPRSQTFLAWIETRRNSSDKWLVASRSGVSYGLPDPAEPHHLRDGRCQPDIEYGTAWRAQGTDHNGVAFDTGIMRRLFGATGLC